MFQNQPETIFVNLFDEVKLDIVEEAMKWPGKETGGMLFGTIENTEGKQTISISKVVIPPEETAIRKSSYFEIDPEYSREILDQETALYLGNWHKHLGFGGPSKGDKAQIGDFFQNNPHRNTILTLIIDCLSEEEYNFILEVYRGNEISEHDSESPSFKVITFRENNSIFESVNTSISTNSISERGISEALITRLKQELVEVYNSVSSVEDIYLLDGSHPAEKIVSFPYRFLVDTEGQIYEIDLRIQLSFPPTFPDGEIFVDLSSQDQSRNITIQTYPGSYVSDQEQIQPFLELIRIVLEEKATKLLVEPLWKIMRD